MTRQGTAGSEPWPAYPKHLDRGFVPAPAPSPTVLCEECGIHQRKRHERRCETCNATLGAPEHDGGPVTIETVGRDRYRNNVMAQAAVMAGMRLGPFVRLLLDELEKTTERLVVAECMRPPLSFVITASDVPDLPPNLTPGPFVAVTKTNQQA